MCRLIVAACLLIGFSPSSAIAQVTRVVDRDGQGSAANCNDTVASFATVGAAITAATNGDTVLVCPGTYVENINFGGKAITVRSAAGPAVTILDGNAIDSVVMFVSGESSTSVLEGFTIRNGRAQFGGGGIRISSASPVIRRNLIVGNSACDSLGIDITFGSPLVEYNTIANNVQAGCSGGTVGGGISIGGASQAIIRYNNINNNRGVWLGGGIGLFAAGSPIIMFNVISGNSAEDGGGIGIVNGADLSIVGNVIVRNQAASGGGIYWPASSGSSGVLVNNTIADNDSAAGSGVFVDSYNGSVTLWNNIIAAASGQTAVLCQNTFANQVPTFRSNDVFSASGTAYGGICTDQTGFNGNITADPMFVQPTIDYHLLPNSPAVDAGNINATGLPSTDLDGHARVLDGNGDSVAVVDIGADEAPSTGTAPAAFGKSNPINTAQGQASRLSLTWDASAGATGYEYCVDKIDNGACDGIWTPAWNATTAVLFGLDGGTTYYWQVRAINAAGLTYANSGAAYWSFTTEVPVLTRIIGLSGDLNFGTVLAGRSVTRTLTISNTGTDLLTVTSISYPNGFNGFWSGTVAPGGTRDVTVTFFPNSQGTYSGTITVMGDQTGGTNSIAVSGTAIPVSRIMTMSGDLTFGNVQAGTNASRIVTVSNRGNDTLSVFGLSYPPGFSGFWSGNLAPGESHSVLVTFAPTLSTGYGGAITISANQTFGTNTVMTSGTGTLPPGLQVPWQHATTGALETWFLQGSVVTAQLPLSISQVADLNWKVVGTGDLNGDGMPDVVWQHAFDGWLAVWFMNGNVAVGTQLLGIERVADLNWSIRAVGDVDGDGYADLIWQHRTGGWLAVWRMNGTQVVSTALLSVPQLPVDWQIVGAGDLNGDGKADLVFQHRTEGWLAAWYLDGATVTATQLLSINRVTDPAWHIRGVGDVDRDGHADLLWQNDTSGALAVWLMNGTAVVSTSLLSSARGDANWRMVGPG